MNKINLIQCERHNEQATSNSRCPLCEQKEVPPITELVKVIDELPSIYSADAPPYMQMRILWNKVNEIIKIINKDEYGEQ